MGAPPARRHGSADAAGGDVREVVSTDGTRIVLEQVTRGRLDLLLVAGGASSRSRWAGVAALLDGAFSCWLMDRRGKGDSGDGAAYSFEREYEDLAAAVASLPGPVTVGAHSSGASCVLGAALRGVPMSSLVLYEPPWPLPGCRDDTPVIDRVEASIADGDGDAALRLALQEIVGLSPATVDALTHTPMWAQRRSLVSTWPREMREIARLPQDLTGLATINVPTLLMTGTTTPHSLRRATQAIATALPNAVVVELPGQGHGALDLAPHLVAEAVRVFTGRTQPPGDARPHTEPAASPTEDGTVVR